ncbi:GNAT family N-acetyltransferase [Paenibacillus psychroresistens]|uniref:GNAT family N-acetyltransferase n=1 Tax=Paenibacillus psychroresistens TaxID=1778678 RepID=A0A6B8RU83_9BACL|nr:GNAT family N-acetyltransferase [Paenibacillus psychroresistens]QGQ99497.1 GNAT family N-acetyltransferase [Paenibacillus psychroresistens]
MDKINVQLVSHESIELIGLIAKLDEDLYQRYPEDEVHVVDFTDPSIAEIVFIIAYQNETPVGCGAIRPIDADSTELKRFYVEPAFRQQGIAKQMLVFLEEQAKALQFTRIKLETGAAQPEAVNFYEKHGYQAIDKFGEYVDCISSLCYEKVII